MQVSVIEKRSKFVKLLAAIKKLPAEDEEWLNNNSSP
jgi:hypothetical protein